MSDEKKTKIEREEYSALPLVRRNFVAMAVCGLLIILGFALMVGGGSADGTFNPEIFSTRRIVIGPAIALLGFVGMAVAIIIKPKAKDNE